MTNYRRNYVPGGIFFFTVALTDRSSHLLVQHIAALREAIRYTRRRHPFEIIAWVVLPDHLHTIWKLPDGDCAYATRWRLIKSAFSRTLPPGERRSRSRVDKAERAIWQRRYWEHTIRDDTDLRNHVDYIHFNPVKHGLVEAVKDWPYSTFHRYVQKGIYPPDWAGSTLEPDRTAGEPAQDG